MVRRLLVGCIAAIVVLTSAAPVTAEGFPTIDGQSSGLGAIGPGRVLDLTVVGRGGVPASGVDAVAINVTATGSTAESYLTVYPAGTTRPTASNLNFTVGATNPNMVVAKVGAGGQISIFNLSGRVDVIVDVLGWFPVGGSFTSLSPARLFDSRGASPTIDGQFAGGGRLLGGETTNMTVTGRGGVPTAGVDAVVLNVTATNATTQSYLTLWPTGADRPTASNLNFSAGETRPNMVIAKVGVGGQISIFNFVGSTDVIVDVLGWFPSGGAFVGLSPARILETRSGLSTVDGISNAAGALGPGSVANLTVIGRGGVPISGVGAVAVNVTSTEATAESYLTVWPTGVGRPVASNVNFRLRQTTPNMVIVPVGLDGQISLFNFAGTTHAIVDVLGWFPSGGGFNGLTPARLLDTRIVPYPALTADLLLALPTNAEMPAGFVPVGGLAATSFAPDGGYGIGICGGSNADRRAVSTGVLAVAATTRYRTPRSGSYDTFVYAFPSPQAAANYMAVTAAQVNTCATGVTYQLANGDQSGQFPGLADAPGVVWDFTETSTLSPLIGVGADEALQVSIILGFATNDGSVDFSGIDREAIQIERHGSIVIVYELFGTCCLVGFTGVDPASLYQPTVSDVASIADRVRGPMIERLRSRGLL